MKKILPIAMLLFLLFPIQKLSAEPIFDFYLGLSGTTSIFWVLDEITESQGEFMDYAAHLGLISGEGGFSFRIQNSLFGIGFEGIAGYYQHFTTIVPISGYVIFETGVEPYVHFKSFWIGLGVGYFCGYMFLELLQYRIVSPAFHHGVSSWVSFGVDIKNFFAISTRIRYHHFVEIGDIDLQEYKPLADDFVFVLRFIYRLRL